MYVSIAYFKRGSFIRTEPPYFTKDALAVYDKAVAKYSKLPDQEVLIALRNDNHILVKCWSSVKQRLTYNERLKSAKS